MAVGDSLEPNREPEGRALTSRLARKFIHDVAYHQRAQALSLVN